MLSDGGGGSALVVKPFDRDVAEEEESNPGRKGVGRGGEESFEEVEEDLYNW